MATAESIQQRMDALESTMLRRPTGILRPSWYAEFLSDPNQFYRTYYIPKTEMQKKMAGGYRPPYPRSNIPASEIHLWRKISAPIDPLKEAQKNVANALYSRSPSPYDYCVRGRNRYMAMSAHANFSIIIALDIKDAFPSTTTEMVRRALTAERFNEDDVDYICNIAMHKGSLPQGSPASPILLNLARKRMDHRIGRYVKARYKGNTTVYVDNYFISSNDTDMNKGIPSLKEIATQEEFNLNNKKIYIMRKGRRMSGLGLVVSHKPVSEADVLITEGVVTRDLGYIYRPGRGYGRNVEHFVPVVQPSKRDRDRIRAILHQAEKRLESGEYPQPGFNLLRVKGLVETCNGSVYYSRFKDQLSRIESLLSQM